MASLSRQGLSPSRLEPISRFSALSVSNQWNQFVARDSLLDEERGNFELTFPGESGSGPIGKLGSRTRGLTRSNPFGNHFANWNTFQLSQREGNVAQKSSVIGFYSTLTDFACL